MSFLELSGCFSGIFAFSKSTFLSQLHFPKESFFSGSSQSQRGTFFPFPPDYGGNPQKSQPPPSIFPPPVFNCFFGGETGNGTSVSHPPLFPLLPWGLEDGLGFGQEREGMGRKGGEKGTVQRLGGWVRKDVWKEMDLSASSSCANTSFSQLYVEGNLNTKGGRKIPCFPPCPGRHINS